MTILFVAVLGLILAAVMALWPRKVSGPDTVAGRDGLGDPDGPDAREPWGEPDRFGDADRFGGPDRLSDPGRPSGGRRWGGPRTPGERWDPVAPWRPRKPVDSAETRPDTPATLEGVLTAQRICGEISQVQYLRALEGLAARDEERHPLVLRWDDRPGACS